MSSILVVDDDPVQLADLKLAAEASGRTVRAVKNHKEAVDLLSEKFDLIVTDLAMEDDDEAGFSVLRAARERDQNCPVIIVTGRPSPARSRRAVELGAFDFVDRNARNVDVTRLLQHKITLALHHR
ncbi:MAG: response regulator [Bryobacteraceae bacterium]|nr:response regulator [Bryobacteraceae bacterium]